MVHNNEKFMMINNLKKIEEFRYVWRTCRCMLVFGDFPEFHLKTLGISISLEFSYYVLYL